MNHYIRTTSIYTYIYIYIYIYIIIYIYIYIIIYIAYIYIYIYIKQSFSRLFTYLLFPFPIFLFFLVSLSFHITIHCLIDLMSKGMVIPQSPVATAESSKVSGCQTSHGALVHENKLRVGCKKVLRTKSSDGCQKVCQTDVPEGSHEVHDDGRKLTESQNSEIGELSVGRRDGVTRCELIDDLELLITDGNDDDEVAMVDTSVCAEQDNEPFKVVGERKHKKETKLSDGPEKQVYLTVYMEGRGGYSLVKAVA